MSAISLFQKRREIVIFSFVCIFIFIANVTFSYTEFRNLKSQDKIFTNGQVLASYIKTNDKNRTYRVLKIKTDHGKIYTTLNKNSTIKSNNMLHFGFYTKNIKFKDYLKGTFYAPSFARKITGVSNNISTKLSNLIKSQHSNEKMGEFYSALFLATPISKELREDVYFWGISHLVAISGYHAGIIFSFSFIVFLPIYKFFQNRYFPYRNSKFDISIAVFTLLCFYLYLTNFVPSFFRSVLMGLIGFYFISRNLKIFNFQTLFLTAMIAICIFPSLIFSIGFYFSMLGVFYIYLYINHFYHKFPLWINLIFLNIWTFLAMVIPVLYFFPLLSFQQLFVVPLTAIFGVFYPLSVFAHLCGYGDFLDFVLINFSSIRLEYTMVKIQSWQFYALNLLSLIAIRYKFVAVFVVLLGILPFFTLI
ncbi:ComEC/Rec2 family competence protein [Campylobacter sputorum]|uniref:ComEC/Rec2 family competence protein n=1 Tax=Campylobacter sputorum TaxID=206 RepID=UPI000B7825ED|nr:ComEC/Rec2 family competence protein [Campylobacter sputorum]ASM36412.1 competence protein, ComEC family [Campylobacter sputorum bv. faecalis CCUG 20703]